MRRYLVVANQTLGGTHLVAKVRECLGNGECRFSIVVPATPPRHRLTWTESDASALAKARLEAALARFRELGAEVEGGVGDAHPLDAIGDALRDEPFDEIILSTLPPGASRWLKADLPLRVRAKFGLPVTHIIGGAETERAPGAGFPEQWIADPSKGAGRWHTRTGR